jgi:hypothetical protein
VMPGRAVEVREFCVSAAPKVPGQRVPRQSVGNWSRVLGLVGTLSLHGLAVHALVFGTINHKPRPPDIQVAGAISTRALPAEELVLITVATMPKADPGLLEQIASLRPHLTEPPVSFASPDPLAVDAASAEETSDSTSQSSPDAGDPTLRALMFGRYTHQISARIERAWIRPRSAVNGSNADDSSRVKLDTTDQEFSCRVQIRQDAHGFVQEVLLLECDGTEVWRHSLVVAINQSSPLPAAPIPSVFADALTMTFQAHAYKAGTAPDGYERETREESPTFAGTSSDSSLRR